GGGLHAVAAVARRRHRRPVAARAGLRRAVDLQGAGADEVAAVAAVHGRGRLVADRAGPDISRLEAAVDGDVDGARAEARTRAGGGGVDGDGDVVGRGERAVVRGQAQDVAARGGEGGGGGLGARVPEGHRPWPADLGPGGGDG